MLSTEVKYFAALILLQSTVAEEILKMFCKQLQ